MSIEKIIEQTPVPEPPALPAVVPFVTSVPRAGWPRRKDIKHVVTGKKGWTFYYQDGFTFSTTRKEVYTAMIHWLFPGPPKNDNTF